MSNQDLSSLSLDELFKEARSAMQRQQERRAAEPKERRQTEPTLEINLHSNWVAQRSLALVHQETKRLLGTFTEYTNKHFPGARRLVREFTEIPTQTSEYVTGVWGAPSFEPVSSGKRPWNTSRTMEMDLVLRDLHVSAAKVLVAAYYGEGTLDAVELVEATTFASPPGAIPFSFFNLPAGTNVLPELSIKTINAIREVI
jgi:hypothetical protein